MPPLILWTLGVVGAMALARFLVREARRINTELHPVAPAHHEPVTLERDPKTDVYRPK